MKTYIKNFIRDEEGMEILQFAIVILITVGLIGVIMTIGKSIKGQLETTNDTMNSKFSDFNNAAAGTTGGGSGAF